MTILTVVEQVSMAVGLARPLQVFGNTAREWREMQSVVNEAAAVILQAYDWQKLKKQHVITGDGSAEAHAMPSDYRRMLKKGNIWSSRYRWNATHIPDLDRWTELTELAIPVADLKLNLVSLASLTHHGYETVADLIHLSDIEILRIPNVGGRTWLKLAKALGRKA